MKSEQLRRHATQQTTTETSASNSLQNHRDLQEQFRLHRVENERSHHKIQKLESCVARFRTAAQRSKEERDRLKKKVRQLQTLLAASNSNASIANTTDCDNQCRTDEAICERYPIVPKFAERVRLQRTACDDAYGSEICALGIVNVKVAEHLADKMIENDELGADKLSPNVSFKNGEFEFELMLLHRKLDYLRSQISFLEATLSESRSLNDTFSSVCAQLESNEAALKLALRITEFADEANDRLLLLADSQQAVLLASCQALDIDGENKKELHLLAQKELIKAEANAKDTLDRLKRNAADLLSTSDKDSFGNTQNDLDGHNDMNDKRRWSRQNEIQLRGILKTLQTQKAFILRSLVNVDSASNIGQSVDFGDIQPISSLQEQKLILENAVLLQELMSVKEERTRLKRNGYLLEKEKEVLVLTTKAKILEMSAHVENAEEKKTEDDNATGEMCALIRTYDRRQEETTLLLNYLKRENVTLVNQVDRLKRRQKTKVMRLQQLLHYVTEQYELELNTLKAMKRKLKELVTDVAVDPTVGAENLRVTLNEWKKRAEIYLIKKPKQVDVDDIRFRGKGDGNVKIKVKGYECKVEECSSADLYHVMVAKSSEDNKTQYEPLRKSLKSVVTMTLSQRKSTVIQPVEIQNSPVPDETMRQRYVPFGCVSSSDEGSPKKTKKMKKKKLKKPKKLRHD